MKIGIVGAGFIGRAVALLCVQQGHEVMISNSRGPETLYSAVPGLGCLVGTAEQAITFGEMVLVAIPFHQIGNLPTAAFSGKIVMDANNYYVERDGHYPALDQQQTTTSEMLAAQLPAATIVKVFNAIYARDLETDGRPAGTPDRRALPIAGDDPLAKAQVTTLLDQMGFDVVDAGDLHQGWRFQRGMPCYCVPLNAAELANKLAQARRPEGI